MGWMRKLDDFLIDRVFQKFSRWTQVAVGIDSIRWAGFLLVGELLLVLLLETALNLSQFLGRFPRGIMFWLNVVSWPVLGLLVVRGLRELAGLELLKKTIPVSRDGQSANPLRLTLMGMRLGGILVSLAGTGVAWAYPDPLSSGMAATLWTGTAVEYFLACDPLPPKKSKVRAWLESWKKFRILWPVAEH